MGGPHFDREKLIEQVQRKNWQELMRFLQDDQLYREVRLDPIADRILGDYFIGALIADPSAEFLPYLEQFYALHRDTAVQFQLEPFQFAKVVARLAGAYADLGVLETALRYAREAPEEEICRKLLHRAAPPAAQAPRTTPTPPPPPRQHTPPPPPKSTAPPPPPPKPSPTPQPKPAPAPEPAAAEPTGPLPEALLALFGSERDFLFFTAVRDAYPSYFTFPKVALSTVIEYERIRSRLSPEEQTFFLRASIDCVVVGPEDYKPIAFVEARRSDFLQRSDRWKEKILALAGFQLFRVSDAGGPENRRELIRQIKETIKF